MKLFSSQTLYYQKLYVLEVEEDVEWIKNISDNKVFDDKGFSNLILVCSDNFIDQYTKK